MMVHVIYLSILIATATATSYDDDIYYDKSLEEDVVAFPVQPRQEKKEYRPINHLTISDFARQSYEPSTRSWYKPSRANFSPEGRHAKPVQTELPPTAQPSSDNDIIEQFDLFPKKNEHLTRETRQTTSSVVNKKVSNTTIIWLHTTPIRTAGNPTPSPALLNSINAIAEQIRGNLQTLQPQSVTEPSISYFSDLDRISWTEEVATSAPKAVTVKQQTDKTPTKTETFTTESWWPTKFVYAKPTTIAPIVDHQTLGTQPAKLLETKLITTTLKPSRRPPNNPPNSEPPMFTEYTKPPRKPVNNVVSFSPFLVLTEKKQETTTVTSEPLVTTAQPEPSTPKRINLINIVETTTTTTTSTPSTTKAATRRRTTKQPADAIVINNSDQISANEIDDYVYVNIWNLVNGKLRLANQQKIPAKLFGGLNFKDGDMFQASDIPAAVMQAVGETTTQQPFAIEVTSSSLKVSEPSTKSPTLLGQGSIKTLPPSIVVHSNTLGGLNPDQAIKLPTVHGSITPIDLKVQNNKNKEVSTYQEGVSPRPVLVVRPEPLPQLSEFPSGILTTTSRTPSSTRRQRPRTRTTTLRSAIGSQHMGTTVLSSITTAKSIQSTRRTRRPQQKRPTPASVPVQQPEQSYLQALIEKQLSQLSASQLQKLISDPSIFNGTHLTLSGSLPLAQVNEAIASDVVALPNPAKVNSFMETSALQEASQSVPTQTVRAVPLRIQRQPSGLMTRLTSGLSNLGSGNKVVLGFAAVPSAIMAFPYVAPMLGRKKRDTADTKQIHKTINIVPNGYEHLAHQIINGSRHTPVSERVKRDVESEIESRADDYYDDYDYDTQEQPAIAVSNLHSPFLSEKNKTGENPTTLIPIKSDGSQPVVLDISPFLAKHNMTNKQYYQLFVPNNPATAVQSTNVVATGEKKKKIKVKQQMDESIVVENPQLGGTVSGAAASGSSSLVKASSGTTTSILNYFPYYAIPLIALVAPFALLGAGGRRKRSTDMMEEEKRYSVLVPPDLSVFQKYK